MSFIGREREIHLVLDLLARGQARIITLAGAPGIGKSRLALEIAAFLIDTGDWLVSWIDGDSADTLDQLVQPQTEARSLLVVLDIAELVEPARSRIPTLLGQPGDIRVLVTSRARLSLAEEYVVTLGPLEVRDNSALAQVRNESVQLFLERAAALSPAADAEHPDLEVVGEICRRLEGNPLAIELAASRLNALGSPRALLTRMDWGVLPLLVAPSDATHRHSNMAHAIDTSYRQLSCIEQHRLVRAARFEGSFTSAAAAGLDPASPPRSDAHDLDLMMSLVEAGLAEAVPAEVSEPRFRLPTLVREFARDHLAASDEVARVEQSWIDWFVHLAELAEHELHGPHQVRWLARLDYDLTDLTAVLRWAEENEQTAISVRVASALRTYWILRARVTQGLAWLTDALRDSASLVEPMRAKALAVTASLHSHFGNFEAARELFDQAGALSGHATSDDAWLLVWRGDNYLKLQQLELADADFQRSLRIFQDLEIAAGAGWAKLGLADVGRRRAPLSHSPQLYVDSVDTWRRVGDRWGLATALRHAARAAHTLGQRDRAIELYAEAGRYFRELDYPNGLGWALDGQGDLERFRNRAAAAETLYAAAALLFRQSRDQIGFARANRHLACVLLSRFDIAPAAMLLRESMDFSVEHGDLVGLSRCVAACARVALGLQDASSAAQLLSSAHVLAAVTEPADRLDMQRTRDAAIRILGEQRFQAGWDAGAELSPASAEALCRAILDTVVAGSAWKETDAGKHTVDLTSREREVVVLMARGLKDREIADALVMSRSTASWHVHNVLGKLRMSRAQVGVWALENGLLSSTSPPG